LFIRSFTPFLEVLVYSSRIAKTLTIFGLIGDRAFIRVENDFMLWKLFGFVNHHHSSFWPFKKEKWDVNRLHTNTLQF